MNFKPPREILRVNAFVKLQCNLPKEFEWPLTESRPIGAVLAKREIPNFGEIGSRGLKEFYGALKIHLVNSFVKLQLNLTSAFEGGPPY